MFSFQHIGASTAGKNVQLLEVHEKHSSYLCLFIQLNLIVVKLSHFSQVYKLNVVKSPLST